MLSADLIRALSALERLQPSWRFEVPPKGETDFRGAGLMARMDNEDGHVRGILRGFDHRPDRSSFWLLWRPVQLVGGTFRRSGDRCASD